VVAKIEARMTDEKFEEKMPELTERRAYEAPTVRDFFQPLVVLGTVASVGVICADAKPKPPKH
jgi:hypothetical protein